jgi:hypothetical protein
MDVSADAGQCKLLGWEEQNFKNNNFNNQQIHKVCERPLNLDPIENIS